MSVLTLAEAKKHLNITTTGEDDELQATIDAAEAMIAKRVGPLEAQTVTARVSGGPTLVLPVTPVVSLTTVAPTSGADLDLSGIYLDEVAGLASYSTGSATFPSLTYTVTYEAGRTDVPDDLLFAVKELVRHLWRTQRGPTAANRGGTPEAPAPGFLIPYAVAELLEPHVQIGFA